MATMGNRAFHSHEELHLPGETLIEYLELISHKLLAWAICISRHLWVATLWPILSKSSPSSQTWNPPMHLYPSHTC